MPPLSHWAGTAPRAGPKKGHPTVRGEKAEASLAWSFRKLTLSPLPPANNDTAHSAAWSLHSAPAAVPRPGRTTGGQVAAPKPMHLSGKRWGATHRLQTEGVAGRRGRQGEAVSRFHGW
jgi:hypothetical protein